MKKWLFLLLTVIALISFLVFNSGAETEDSGPEAREPANYESQPDRLTDSKTDIVAHGRIRSIAMAATPHARAIFFFGPGKTAAMAQRRI